MTPASLNPQQSAPERTIVIVANAPDVATRARSVARREGFQTRMALFSDLAEGAVDIAEGTILLLDLRLGEPIDAGALAALRCDPRYASIPILALVGAKDDAAMRDAVSAGADEFVRESYLERELSIKLHLLWRRWERERERVEAERRSARYEEIHRHHTDGIIVVDSTTLQVISLNPAARRLFRLEGKTGQLLFHRLAPFKDEEEAVELVWKASEEESLLATLEVAWQSQRAYLEIGASALSDGAVLLAIRDITEVRRRESARWEQDESAARHSMIMELAGAAAHELNQPLTVVLGYAQLLAKKMNDGSVGSRQVHLLRQEAERMAEIVKKLAQIIRYETTEYVEGAKIVDLDRSAPAGDDGR